MIGEEGQDDDGDDTLKAQMEGLDGMAPPSEGGKKKEKGGEDLPLEDLTHITHLLDGGVCTVFTADYHKEKVIAKVRRQGNSSLHPTPCCVSIFLSSPSIPFYGHGSSIGSSSSSSSSSSSNKSSSSSSTVLQCRMYMYTASRYKMS